jgi:hypothetical protein
MLVETSNQVEDFPDVPEESRQEEAIEPPVHLPQNQPPAENVLSPAEEEELLQSLAGEEFGGVEF